MSKLLELQEKRATIWEQAKAFLDEKQAASDTLSTEDAATYDRMVEDVDRMKNEVERLERQQAIDAELNAGIIDETVAMQRRQKLQKETDFYGSMDGANKFVRGDAIAGILITFINIIGGFAIGVLQMDLSFADAANAFIFSSSRWPSQPLRPGRRPPGHPRRPTRDRRP